MDRYDQILQQYWGYSSFRAPQKAVIESFMAQKDLIVLLPTGGGKSLCFQLPALVEKGVTLVVSPLLALMHEQVNALQAKGVPAMFFDRSAEKSLDQQMVECARGDYKLIYCSPERIASPAFLDQLAHVDITKIAVDEAHCISSWGHDFRPAYLNISRLRDYFPQSPIMALTATATPKVLADIQKYLKLNQAEHFQTSVVRSNISIEIRHAEDKLRELYHFVRQQPGVSIVYAYSRKQTEQIADQLSTWNIASHFFHAGLSSEEKNKRINDWKEQHVKVMVATTAFGMGIDFDQVRSVIHWDFPESMENYSQEIGRAGRDGSPANALMLYKEEDFSLLENRLLGHWPSTEEILHVYKKLANYLDIGLGMGKDENFQINFERFCETYTFPKRKTLHVLELMERLELIRLNLQQNNRLHLHTKLNEHQLLKAIKEKIPGFSLLEDLLRSYPQFTRKVVKVSWFAIQNSQKRSKAHIVTDLNKLVRNTILQPYDDQENMHIQWLHPREDRYVWSPHKSTLKQLSDRKKAQLAELKKFILNTKTCRTRQLLKHFGEDFSNNCHQCDALACQSDEIKKDISALLLEKIEEKPLSIDQLKMEFPVSLSELESSLQKLLKEGYICIGNSGLFQKS